MKKITTLLLIFASFANLSAQNSLLQSGPMVGYSAMREVLLWVQTKEAAKVKFIYFEKENASVKLSTEEVMTEKSNAFTAKLLAETVPGKKYEYELYINGKPVKLSYTLEFQSQTLWQYRTDPPAFKFAFGSCAFINETDYDRPGTPYGGEYFIFDEILKQKPAFMLWGGDNVYLREVDFETRNSIIKRYTHTRSAPEMQALLGSVHNYAIWDDHDYGPDNSNSSYYNKENTLDIFKSFWGNQNYGVAGGISGFFSWNDCDFFLLDNRYFRTEASTKTDKATILGDDQIKWVIQALKYSRANFKFVVVGGQVLNDADLMTANWCENFSKYPEERTRLIKAIQDENISGVIFLTGDRHMTELSKLEKDLKYPLYDLTCSSLTAGAAGEKAREEKNTLRVANTFVGVRNFSTLEVTGTLKERKLMIRVFNNKSEELWNYNINANDLKSK